MCGFTAQLVEHRTGVHGGHRFESRWSPDFIQASSFQLLKLENLLRWSFFTFTYNQSSNMNYFIYTSHQNIVYIIISMLSLYPAISISITLSLCLAHSCILWMPMFWSEDKIITFKTWMRQRFLLSYGADTCFELFSGNTEPKMQSITYNLTWGRCA